MRPQNRAEVEYKDGIPQFLTLESLENIPPKRYPRFEGNSSSFYNTHDKDKRDFLERIGVGLPEGALGPEGEIADRAIFKTLFIIVGHIITLENMKSEGVPTENIERSIQFRNKKIENKRVNLFGDREFMLPEKRSEDFDEEAGFSANPTKQLAEEEVLEIVQFAIAEFEKGRVIVDEVPDSPSLE